MGETKTLKGEELIEILNKKFIGKHLVFCINGVIWRGKLDINGIDNLGTTYTAKDVTFLIYKTREYLFIDSNYLGIWEVR